jgi:hypothetical protein
LMPPSSGRSVSYSENMKEYRHVELWGEGGGPNEPRDSTLGFISFLWLVIKHRCQYADYEYIAFSVGITDDWWIGKDLKWVCRGPGYVWRYWGNHENRGQFSRYSSREPTRAPPSTDLDQSLRRTSLLPWW